MEGSYKIRYLPLFYDDMSEIIDYIAYELNNPKAAYELVDKVEVAICERCTCLKAFEPYRSQRKRKDQYYRIYVENFVIYYVVIGDVMEVRRMLYGKRDSDKML
ncbi:MAG: type II toxin-antitoxin system RelE/ParE family toxin [Clostridiales bacterium]|nr:type II toxin-antitoxin system RelE/ParE family toxin [Clostridiales bacterium]